MTNKELTIRQIGSFAQILIAQDVQLANGTKKVAYIMAAWKV